MNDYQRDVRFGANVDPTANDPSWPLRLTHAIERAGLEYIGIQDHPYNSGFLETWTLIATLLQATERVHIFPNVANLPLRPPVMLAKAAATLDVLSGGRVELGLGAGAFREGIHPCILERHPRSALRGQALRRQRRTPWPAPGPLHRPLVRFLWPSFAEAVGKSG